MQIQDRPQGEPLDQGERQTQEVRPSLLLKPETTQEEFYSKTLEGLTGAIGSARKLRNLAVDVRFDDGVIPCFIIDPVNYTLESLNKVRHAVHDTIEVLNYNKDRLKYKVERKKQSEEERRTKPRPDMAGIRDY